MLHRSSNRKLFLIIAVLVTLFSAALVRAATYTFSGEITFPGEEVEHTFFVEAGQYVRVELLCGDPPTLDPTLYIYDPDDEYVTEDDDGGDKECGANPYYSSKLSFQAAKTGVYTAVAAGYAGNGDDTGPYILIITVSDNQEESPWFDPGDARINRQAYASASIYCDAANGQLVVYDIDADGNGVEAFSVPFADLPPTPTDANVLVLQQSGLSLYRLTTGEYQLIGSADAEGKSYVVVWDGCPYTYLNTYILQNGVLTQTESNTP